MIGPVGGKGARSVAVTLRRIDQNDYLVFGAVEFNLAGVWFDLKQAAMAMLLDT
jgi:hypothetical protein